MKVHICSAHFGGKPPNILPKIGSKHHDVTQSFYSDENTPSRINCMHPRLKGKIPKMLEHRVHDADWYIWIDSKFVIKSADLASDVIETAGNSQIILYCHPFRSSIREESELIAERISNGDEYLRSRYIGEPIQEQVAHYLNDVSFEDNKLFAMGFFAYHKTCSDMMRDWFIENAVWTIQDQISFPYVFHKWRPLYTLFEDGDIFDNRYVQHRRTYNKKLGVTN